VAVLSGFCAGLECGAVSNSKKTGDSSPDRKNKVLVMRPSFCGGASPIPILKTQFGHVTAIASIGIADVGIKIAMARYQGF